MVKLVLVRQGQSLGKLEKPLRNMVLGEKSANEKWFSS